MAKIDKSQYTKQEWRKIKEQRRQEKLAQAHEKIIEKTQQLPDLGRAFVLGNGTSRKPISPDQLRAVGKIYG
jgi:hypothetical protein